jgi:hypothetical protein
MRDQTKRKTNERIQLNGNAKKKRRDSLQFIYVMSMLN